MGVAFVKGLQGDDKRYLKAAACAKHYAVHSGPEGERHTFDSVVNGRDLRETYLPAFEALVREGGVEAIMTAYNRVNGEPCSASELLLDKILRQEWGFKGHVVSDCGAVEDIHEHHKLAETTAEAAAMAVKAGCDLCCGEIYKNLLAAVKQGLIDEATITTSVERLFTTRMKLGMFDPEEMVPFNQIPYEVNDSEEHRQLSLEMARESIVLLKNDGLLPLNKDEVKAIAVIGPNADDKQVLLGNYFGQPSRYVTVVNGIRNAVSKDAKVYYAQGCDMLQVHDSHWGNPPTAGFAEALAMAERSDVVVMCLGLSPILEGEEGSVAESDGGGDRVRLGLPGVQEDLLKAISQTGKPIILVLLNGSPLAVNWAHENVAAIIEAWYPGEEGGTAIADVIFGDYNPGGRLPITFVKSVDQLPPFEDYSMKNRTYRYMEDEPLYPFGYGLSYTRFAYSDLRLSRPDLDAADDEPVRVSVQVKNTGELAGDEVVQLYVKDLEASVTVPKWDLRGFQRVHLQPGEAVEVEFELTRRHLSLIDNDGRRLLEPGAFRIYVGGQQPDERSRQLTGQGVLEVDLMVTGEVVELEY